MMNVMRKWICVWVVITLLVLMVPATVLKAEVPAGRGTQITNDASYWERNPRIVKFGTTYYLFYTKSLVSGSADPDGYEYDIYYRTSADGSSWGGATKLTANSVSSGFYGRDVAVTQDGSKLWVFWLNGRSGGQVYYYTYDGSTWSSQQTATGVTSVLHASAVYADSKVWLFAEAGGAVKYWTTTDGTTWTGPTTLVDGPSTDGMPHAIYASGTYRVVYTDWAAGQTGIKMLTSSDGSSWSGPVPIHDTAYDDYDPAIVQDADGGLHVLWAPYEPSSDQQWLVMSSSSDGVVWSTPMRITEPVYGVWDFWTDPYNSGSGDPWLFYTSNDNSGAPGISHIWQTTVPRPVVTSVWTQYAGNPVVAGSMAFDPCVIKDGSTYKMWYTHVDGSGNWTIYYADSADGIAWANQQQVLAPTGAGWEQIRVLGPSVIKDGTTYKMWYAGRDASAVYHIGYADSTDGLSWSNRQQVLDVGGAGSWDSEIVREPWVIKDGSTYKMWYSGTASWPVFKIGYATSPDGTTWTRHASNPVFTGTPGGWDAFQVYAPSVVMDAGGTYHLYFSGTDNTYSNRWSTGYATSSDGVAWTEASRNPILIPLGDDSLDYVSALDDGGAWKLWYSYGGTYAIGLATLDGSTQLYLDPAVASIPNDNSTTQTFTVRITNAADLYGYQFVITFNPSHIEAAGAAFDNSFFSSPLGSPPGWNATIDNVNGRVYFARTRQNPDPAVSGSGPLATVTLRSKSGATADQYKIDFDRIRLGDVEGNELATTTQYAWLSLYGTGNLQGRVDLQGRSNESGGTVTILSASGYLESKTITAADGSWSFSNVPAGSYQVNIEMARYLDAQKGASAGGVTVPAGGTTVLSQVKLLGGDADDSDLVTVGDATIIGGEFGNSPPTDVRADINNDSTVDILDLVLMGGNYGKTSPVSWP